jgi:hypothetical protein
MEAAGKAEMHRARSRPHLGARLPPDVDLTDAQTVDRQLLSGGAVNQQHAVGGLVERDAALEDREQLPLHPPVFDHEGAHAEDGADPARQGAQAAADPRRHRAGQA